MDRLIRITDGTVEAGVIPDLGGMVALLRLRGERNILKADETLWRKPPVVKKTFGPSPRWTAYNGHIVWLGPQSEWWTRQNKNLRKKERRDVWPPDPYINNGNFEVIKHRADEVVMLGPESEFSGVQLTKTVRIKNGKVYFKVCARNIRREPVSWDLWLNTRVDGYAKCYAPVSSKKNIRIDDSGSRASGVVDAGEFLYEDGYMRVTSKKPSKNKTSRFSKAFIAASRGMMAAFTSSQALVIKFKKHAAKLIHPEQALVEFYNYTGVNKEDALTELEYHAPYVTLEPGEVMGAEQVWEVYKFKADPKHEECVKFLDDI